MKKIATFLILVSSLTMGPVWAIDGPVDEHLAKWADHDSYALKAPGVMMYGLYEIGEAPFELLNQPYDQTVSKKDHAFGFFKGINKGTYNLLAGFTQGTFNVLRSLVPGLGRYQDSKKQTRILPGLAA